MKYLLQISIGPIQDFISAARRTRDLWFGSTMLSEIAKSVALSVKNSGGQLIFPAPKEDEDLQENSNLSVANIILAEFENTNGENLKIVSDKALSAAKERLNSYAVKVWNKMQNWIVKSRWESQLDDIIEFYSAWVPIVDENYFEARKNVVKLLAARKNIRDFQANKCNEIVPKSSLDGLRESVLIRNLSEKDLEGLPPGVQLKPKESLDAIGLIKRVPDDENKDDKSFNSVMSVALGSWTRGKGKILMSDENSKKLYRELLRDDNSVIEDIAWHLGKEFSAHIPETPYLAFLCADGDKMGAALSNIKDAEGHRKFSKELSSFAQEARDVIRNYHGTCIYTGGDDVMAFLPLDTVLDCARELHDKFGEIMGRYEASLSVGVSIAHAMEDLAQLLQYGRDAEIIAKKGVKNKAVEQGIDRNGLAISVRSRGNIPFTVREQWKDKTTSEKLSEKSLDERIKYFAECFKNNEIPTKFPYELRENAKFYQNWKVDENLKNAVVEDVTRIFANKDIKLKPDEKKLMNEYIKVKVHDSETIKILADELILAQWIASGMNE